MRSVRAVTSAAAFAAFGAVAMWSCGGGSTASPASPSPTPGAQTVTVAIVGPAGNQAYQPNPVSANTGDTVLFKNNDSQMHHIVLDDGSGDLGDVLPGASSKSFVVKSPNAASYHCTIHSSMVGSINGRQAPDPPPCPDPSGYGC